MLLTDFAAARQFIPARPYCLSGLREELYPCNNRMSTPATTDFPTFEAEVICPESPGRHPPRKIQFALPEVARGLILHLAAPVDCGQDEKREMAQPLQCDPADTLPPGGHSGFRSRGPASRTKCMSGSALKRAPWHRLSRVGRLALCPVTPRTSCSLDNLLGWQPPRQAADLHLPPELRASAPVNRVQTH